MKRKLSSTHDCSNRFRLSWFLILLATVSLPLFCGCRKSPPPPAAPQPFPTTLKLVLDLGNGVELPLTRIEPGEFDMGTPPMDSETAWANRNGERPVRHVSLGRPFYMGIHEVTRGQWARFAEEAGYVTSYEKYSKLKGNSVPGGCGWNGTRLAFDRKFTWRETGFPQTDNHPVVLVEWDAAQAFCQWLSRRTGHKIRLPTEAEWEYAGRAGTNTLYFWGEDRSAGKEYANMPDLAFNRTFQLSPDFPIVNFDDGYPFTSPVGSFQPNAWGLYDMQGNVWEWCQDWYMAGYIDVPPNENPIGRPPQFGGGLRACRGGSWCDIFFMQSVNNAADARVVLIADVSRRTERTQACDTGFRIVLEMPDPAP